MRYLANRRLDITPPGTETTQHFEPGEVIVDYDSWPPHAQRTMLETGMVRLDTSAVLDDGSCATCGQPVRSKKGKAA